MKKKLLIVDDQSAIRKLLLEVFLNEDYEIFEAANGEQALLLLDRESPDLVILDMKMPGLSGSEVLEMIYNRDSKAIVVVITAYTELNLVQRRNRVEPTMEFSKPFDIYELKHAVRNLLHKDVNIELNISMKMDVNLAMNVNADINVNLI